MTFLRSPLSAGLPLLVLTLAGGATGCHAWNRLWGKDSVDLSKANVQAMSVDIRKERKTICPREPVQMAVFADVILEGEKDKKSFETWAGRNANKNDKIDFVDFAFHSEQGEFDKDGWFAPASDLLATTDKEFEIKTVFKRQPDKFSFSTKYKPDYQCITGAGKGGSLGSSGSSGPSGSAGNDGQLGSDSQGGGTGTHGGNGGPGGDGGNGGNGPSLKAFVTMVKTPFYDKLVAIKVQGDMQDFLLAPVDQPITLRASGGAGGAGGNGGEGGHGGQGGGGNPGGEGGQGGQGGNGGKGGAGGAGGSIDLTFDSRYPELSGAVHFDVSGGEAGEAGGGGGGGRGGSGGNGITPSGATSSAPSGQSGGEGSRGSSGTAGQRGADGHASAHAGAVSDQFNGLQGVTLLDAGGAAASAPAPDPAASKTGKSKPAKGGVKNKVGGSTP